ncbi:hypothetical protein IFM89_013520 [Coptis chinensis]|uniref:CYTH domain-containing protein n=1 Tax=Coptis chinensis TaxID=261450 RepID=A0A835H533_9MAGN|nr:hypothetical protein IFM89_013520 [Coptis chinensis]
MERETMRENMDLELEEGEIPLSPTKVEKKLGDQVNVFADSFDTEKRRVDKGKRKLEECYDDEEEDFDDNYHYDNKKQKKAVVKGKKNNKKVGKGAVIRTKEKAPEPLIPKGMKDIIDNVMKGKGLRWLNTKNIYKSDVYKSQNHLYMPKEVVELLRTEELNDVNETIPFMVHVLSTRDEVWKLNFNYWGGVGQDRNETMCFAINIHHDGASKKEASTSSPAFTNGASTGGHGGHGGNDDGAITIKANTSRDHGVGGGNGVDVVPNGANTNDGACGSSGGGAVTNEAITIDQGNSGGNGGGSIITNGASTSDDGNCGGDATRIVREEFFSGGGEMEFVCLGGFRNVRGVYDWNGLKLELDETQYDFSISYEIECESDDPENVKMALEKFLNENSVEYSYSEVSKFAVCRSGKLSEDCSRYGSENVNDNILVKATSAYGDARIHVEKEQEDLNRLLTSQVRYEYNVAFGLVYVLWRRILQ